MDSKYMELEVENLFSSDRFSGYDIFESGTRVNYGLNFIQNYNNNQKVSLFIGQNFNIDVPDDIYLENSGLKNGSGASDIVASIDYYPSSTLHLQYKTRMDNTNFKINRNDVNLFIGPRALNLTINYVYLRNMYIEDELPVKKDEINAYLSSQLTNNWKIFVGNRYDLEENRDINIIGGLVYENDCFKFALNVINEFTRDRDYVGDKAVYFSLTFKTLGTVSSSFGLGNSTE
jgi:LPS-assembly protein